MSAGPGAVCLPGLEPVMHTIPDLASYDFILINTSAGKDSLVMLDELARLAGEQQVADRVVVVHADLGRVEWKGTRELAERQTARYGFRFEVVTRTDGADLLDYIERRGMWPSSSARYCTSDLKRGPIRRLMTRLADEFRAASGEDRPCRILNCMGLRAAESSARAKKNPFEHDAGASTKTTRKVDNWLPVFDWSDEQVWEHIADRSLEYHPAYDLDGVSRLSCVMCVLAGDAQVRAGIRHNPDLALEYVAAERRMGHTFKVNQSIEGMVDEVLGAAVPVTIGVKPKVLVSA